MLFQMKRGTICQLTVVYLDFCLISNSLYFRVVMYVLV